MISKIENRDGNRWIVIDNQMAMLKKFAPDCKVMVMLPLDAPLWWLEQHPDSVYSYFCIGEAVFDRQWVADCTDYVNRFLEYAEEKYGDDIFAYSFSGGMATEWFDKAEYYEPSERKKPTKPILDGTRLQQRRSCMMCPVTA